MDLHLVLPKMAITLQLYKYNITSLRIVIMFAFCFTEIYTSCTNTI